jgi:hypothetical protein
MRQHTREVMQIFQEKRSGGSFFRPAFEATIGKHD